MKKHFIYLSLLAFVLTVAACKKEHEKELGQLKEIRTLLVRTDSSLAKINREELEETETEIKNNSQFIQFNINQIGDTLDFKTALFLTDYRTLRTDYEIVISMHKRASAAVDSAQKNLDNLEHDLQNNSLAEGLTAEGAVEREGEQAEELFKATETIWLKLRQTEKNYATLAPKIKEYMAQLNQRLAEKQAAGQPK
jgi:hypothetical protein